MLRPRLQRAVERLNASPVPFVVSGVVRAREGRLVRWELRLLTPSKPWSPVRIPLSLWRREEPVAWRARHPGARVLPFQEPRRRRQAG